MSCGGCENNPICVIEFKRKEQIMNNPTPQYPKSDSTHKIESLTDEEQVGFMAHFYHEEGSRNMKMLRCRNRLIILLMLDAGLRVGEVSQLTVGDLHIAGSPVGLISIRSEIAKTKTGREVPVTIRLHDSIQEMWLNIWQPSRYQPWTKAFLDLMQASCLTTRRIRQICTTAGIVSIGRSVHPHMLRHTFATRLMRTTNIRVVQQLLGHASLSSTQVYTHPNQQDLQTAIDALNK